MKKHLIFTKLPKAQEWITFCGWLLDDPEKLTSAINATTCLNCQRAYNKGRVAGQGWTEYAAPEPKLESFQDTVRNDPDMTPEQKAKWLRP